MSVDDAEILEAMIGNEITTDMCPKSRFPIKVKIKIGGRGKPAFRNLETEISLYDDLEEVSENDE